jgi:type VI secretion system protein ImpE
MVKMNAFDDAAAQYVRNGDPAKALITLQEEVRARPADPKLRVFLFQLLCVLGHWDRALNQLKVASELDRSALAMAQMYGDAIRCEVVRADVFDGKRVPLVLGEPEQWLALLIESLLVHGRGDLANSEELRLRAYAEAPTSSGELNGQSFGWICDADSRLGPVLEAVINGRYYWVPFSRLNKLTVEPPADLRDVVWMPAHLQFQNGGETVALVPTRYPGSERAADGSIALARKTTWDAVAPDVHHGLGQRMLVTDSLEIPLMDVRALLISEQVGEAAASFVESHG